MSELLNEKTPIRARHIGSGQGQAIEVGAGEFLQIQTVQGKQVADFVAFRKGDASEFLSTAATRSTNANIVPQLGMTLYSNRRQPLFEIVEDTVGRHDMLYACCDPVRYEMLGAEAGHASCREALTEALAEHGIGYDRIPDPINWFMNVSIQQRGELEIREPLAEAGDYVLLRAIVDAIAAVSACPQDIGATNASHPTDLVVRVYRDAPLPGAPAVDDGMPPDGVLLSETSEGSDRPEMEGAAVAAATVEAADSPTAAKTLQAATVAAGAEAGYGRPAKLSDTVEASVIRIEEPGTGR